MELDGRVALVTGASRGIGRGIALDMAEAGADVLVNYLENKKGAEQTVADIRAKGGTAILHQADVRDRESVQVMVDAAIGAFGKVDILVNNAGTYASRSFMDADAAETFQDIVSTHIFGSFNCAQAVLPSMREQARGDILFITSLATKQLWADEWAYATAKSAMTTMAQCIAKELSWHGIRVNCIAPTIVESDMGLDLVLGWAGVDDPEQLYGKVPFDRLIKPHDVGDLCVFLASDRASHISGQVIFLDAGVGPASLKDFVGKGS
jgi:3-oxoacyl-[acyl-carrier protein] reductase